MFATLGAKLLAFPLISRLFGWGKGTAVPFIQNNAKTAICYFLIAMVIASASLAVTMWFQRERLDRKLETAQGKIGALERKVIAVETINREQQGQIENLASLREIDAKALTGLNDDYRELDARDARMHNKLNKLENTNATVRGYLDTPVPDDLRKLLNDR
jgi:septal ring factor EnvC (AmiA/AmiB activator)